MSKRKILFFELNEVPLRIVRQFCGAAPGSALAKNLHRMRQIRTQAPDSVLSPWITWPTLHRGVDDALHGLRFFGQDLTEVDARYPPLWRILAAHGVKTGVFGSLHSYPMPEDVRGYAFYMPDTFAPAPDAHPDTLAVFQDFNLTMARKSARNVSRDVPGKGAFQLLRAMPDLGIRASTLADVSRQLVSERIHDWQRIRRRTYQSVLGFDVFMKQMEDTRPDFATFFTNHVASAMHRYWAASFPGDFTALEYDWSWVARYRHEIQFAMSKFDAFLKRLIAFVERNPEYVLWIASSMGQAASSGQPIKTQLYITDLARFMTCAQLGGDDWSERPAMAPRISVFVREARRDAFRATLDSFKVNGEAVAWEERNNGFFAICMGQMNLDPSARIEIDGQARSLSEAGLSNVEIEDQAGSTAYHVPEGMLLVFDPRAAQPEAAPELPLDTRQIAPSVLRHFGVPVPSYMVDPVPLA
ncbi:hypothetical protein WMF18_35070 [Sorangium sp. So ce315]|uniref:hypothetical protein n=1 Tax=Sorangium sp. So ce315 TaxID=3133299 RepID=UPI003F5E11FF